MKMQQAGSRQAEEGRGGDNRRRGRGGRGHGQGEGRQAHGDDRVEGLVLVVLEQRREEELVAKPVDKAEV